MRVSIRKTRISIGIRLWKDGKMFIVVRKMLLFFYSCTYFLSRIMKINEKNAYFDRNYALERWKDVYSGTKNASIFFIHVHIFLAE